MTGHKLLIFSMFFLLIASTAVLADPGQNSTLLLQSGSLNGEAISPTVRTITVTPGEAITGDLTVAWDSAWNPAYGAPIGYTPTWGDHETIFFWDGTHARSTGTKTFSIDTTAPTSEGTYYLIFAYRAEIDGGDVFSMTNWAVNPEIWNDGNDVASFSQSQINTANAQGNVEADVLFASGMQSAYLPATAVIVIVAEDNGSTAATVSVLPPFPQEHNYAFACTTDLNGEVTYAWDFGDGTTEQNLPVNDVYHTFPQNGTNIVTCTAANGTQVTEGSKTVTVMTPSSNPTPAQYPLGEAHMEITHVEDRTYDIFCKSVGFTAFGAEYEVTGNGLNHNDPPGPGTTSSPTRVTFPSDGEYALSCLVYLRDEHQLSQYYNHTSFAYHDDDRCDNPYGCLTASVERNFIVTSSQNQTTCYNSLNDLPANCTGTITSDVKAGSRTIACSTGSGSVEVQAWEKTDSTGTYFEIWRQSYSGTPPTVCIGNDCLQPGWGYERGDYFPYCTNEEVIPAQLTVLPGFPLDHNYAFECFVNEFAPTNYTFTFGDGTTETRPVNDIYHTFPGNGTFSVSCTTTDGVNTAQDSMQVNVQTGTTEEPDPASGEEGANTDLLITKQEDMYYEVTCEDYGFEADGHTWEWRRIVNETGLLFSPSDENNDPKIYGVTFTEPGEYRVTCQPIIGRSWQTPMYYDYSTDEYHNSDICNKGCGMDWAALTINISEEQSTNIELSVAPGFPIDHNAVFQCNATEFTPTSYMWNFGDGTTMDTSSNALPSYAFHTFSQGHGTYTVTCTAAADAQSATATTPIVISTPSTPPIEDSFQGILTANQVAGREYNLTCDGIGFTGQSTNWDIAWPSGYHDGISADGQTITYTFPSDGEFGINCRVMGFNEDEHPDYYMSGNVPACGMQYGCFDSGDSKVITVSSQPNPITCYNQIAELSATCTGGSFTTDSTSGSCRTLVCEGSGSGMQVLACDKPDGSPEYFEMYKQSQSGNAIEEICLADSCITNGQYDGYERGGNYPICTGEGSDPVCGNGIVESGETCDDGNTLSGDGCSSSCQEESVESTSVDLRVKEWYPQGRDYVFICEESGYDANSYFWNFGDGQTQTTTANNVYHVYGGSGQYAVLCETSNGAIESDTLQITVS